MSSMVPSLSPEAYAATHTHLVYSTSTEQATARRTGAAGIARVASAPRPEPSHGHAVVRYVGFCTSCDSYEVALDTVTGTCDLSSMGESTEYPVGYGCELCA